MNYKVIAFLAGVMLINGCAVNGDNPRVQDKLLDKTESATGVLKENLKIVNGSVSSSFDTVNYKAVDNKGSVYKCYYTRSFFVESDSLCTKLDNDGVESKKISADSNTLLKAAGRCN